MNISSVNLEYLTAEFPSNKETVARVVDFFKSRTQGGSASQKVFSINRIYDVIEPPSQAVLAKVLRRLVQEGLLDEFIRVEFDSMGVGDFPSLSDVPEEIYDWHRDVNVTVQPEQLRLYYKIHG